jgi:hypothetical protein
MEGGGGADAGTNVVSSASHSGQEGDGAAPVHGHDHDNHNDHAHHQPTFILHHHHREQDSPRSKSRPVSLNDLQEARKAILSPIEHGLSDLEHYFVSLSQIAIKEEIEKGLTIYPSLTDRSS